MIGPILIQRRQRRYKAKAAAAPAPPPGEPLVIEDASFSVSPLQVYLSFDRDVNISWLVPSQVSVKDGTDTGKLYIGTSGATQPAESVVVIPLAESGEYEGDQQLLEASASTGIVASDDGGTWAGEVDMVLPYGG